MTAFDRAWKTVKKNDETPDEDFHRLNDPNPTIALGANLRNDPKLMDFMQEREQYFRNSIRPCEGCGEMTDFSRETPTDKFCSEGCARGMPHLCKTGCGKNGWDVQFYPPQHGLFGNNPNPDSIFPVDVQCKDCGIGYHGDLKSDLLAEARLE